MKNDYSITIYKNYKAKSREAKYGQTYDAHRIYVGDIKEEDYKKIKEILKNYKGWGDRRRI